MPFTDRLRQNPRRNKVALAAGLFVAVMIGLLVLELRRSHQREMAYASAVTRSITRTMEQQMLGALERVDLSLQEAAFQYAAHRSGTGPPADEMNAILARHLTRLPGMLSLRVIDETGRYVFDASGAPSTAWVGDRRYFTVHADDPAVGLYPEGPLFSRVVKRWTLTFSRGVRDKDNRFLGIVQSSIEIESLADAFARLSLGLGDNISLFNGDGALIARHPATPDRVGKVNLSAPLAKLIAAGTREADYSAVSAIDGVEKLFTVRRLGSHPFYLLAGISYDAILGEWRRTAMIYGATALALLGLLAGLGVRVFGRYDQTMRLADEQRRLTAEVFANALEGIVVTDRDNRIIAANRAAAAITGYDADELVGQTPALMKSGRHDRQFYEDFWRVLLRDGKWQGEIWNCRKSGEEYPEWLSVSCIRDDQGQIQRYIAIYTDISQQKQVEQRLRFANADLHRLTEIMAHHFQEPVRRLATFSQRLRQSLSGHPPGGEVGASLDFIEHQAIRLRALLRDIQLYLAADRPLGPIESLALGEAARQTVARLSRLLAPVGANVTIMPDMPAVRLDARRLATILEILIDNAVRYRHPGRALHIQIKAEAEGSRVRLRVADNGEGIAPEFRDRVFNVFERLYPEHGDSTGIGLAIVRRIVEQGNGEAWIEETPGGGATIVIELPAGTEP